MKSILIMMLAGLVLTACNAPSEKETETSTPAASTVPLPYTADYSSQWTQDVSDQDLATVLNSYKAWETGDMAALRATLSDSISFEGWDGTLYDGTTDGLLERWKTSRDSLSSVEITMNAWIKSHSVDKNADFVSVWYKEVDTYKDGRTVSAYWQDVNMVVNGKIRWYSQHRRAVK